MGRSGKTIREPARTLPVHGTYDLVVAGGGIAGVAAAVAAARLGVSVCLLERTFALGGLATLGNVIVWLPLCDGRGRKVIGGLAEELLKLSVAEVTRNDEKARIIGIPEAWRENGDPAARRETRYRVEFNPAYYLLALEKLIVESGVTLLYDTRVCAVHRTDERISHLIVENKSGRQAIACGHVIDATGDADLCFLAGEATESLSTNVLAGWFYYLASDRLQLCHLSNRYSPAAIEEGACGPFFRGDDAEQVTAQLLGSRQLIRQRLSEMRAEHPDAQAILPPSIPCLRMTRRLVGSISLGERHMHEWCDDAVGFTGDWRRRGPVYAYPWRTLCGVQNPNLLAVGRCMSADTTVWDVTRAIPGCAVTGEAAGVGAALAIQQRISDLRRVPLDALQDQLRSQGVLLDPALLAPALE